MTQESDSPRDLYVRVALLEQAMMHAEATATLHQGMADARTRAAEDQIGRLAGQITALDGRTHSLEWWSHDTTAWLHRQQGVVEDISKRQGEQETRQVRLRWGLAVALLLAVTADQVGMHDVAQKARVVVKGLSMP